MIHCLSIWYFYELYWRYVQISKISSSLRFIFWWWGVKDLLLFFFFIGIGN